MKYFLTLEKEFCISRQPCDSLYILHYRGGKICMTDHFKPLWGRNVPKFGIAHAMALGVSACACNLLSKNIILNKTISKGDLI